VSDLEPDADELAIPTRLGTLHVRRRGNGPLVVLWPSLLMDGSLWDGVTAQLSRRWTTLALDPPGHGRSEPLRRSFTLDECAGALLDVLDHAEVDRAHVVGNSWGGMVGATFAARHGDRLGAAVLMNATASAASRFQRLEYGAMLTAGRVLGGIRGPLTRSVLKAFLGPTSLRSRPHAVAHVRATARAVDLDSVAWAVRSVVPDRPDQRSLLARIDRPVLVVAGREDATFPVAETRAMADAIPGAEWWVVEDGAHLVALELPDVVTPRIADFLARHD